MILDKALMFLKNAAFDATSAEIDLSGPYVGRGEPLKIVFQGGLDFVAASGAKVTLQTDTEEGGSYTEVGSMSFTQAEAREGVFKYIPFPTLQWAQIVLSGATVGTNINCGVVLDAQSGM